MDSSARVETRVLRGMTFKLVAAFAVVALVGVLIVAFLANRLTSTAFGDYVEQGALTQDQRIADYIVEQYAGGGWRSVTSMLIPISHSTDTRLVVADTSGKVVADSSGRLANGPVPSPAPGRQVPLKADGKSIGTLYVADSASGMSGMMGRGNMMGAGPTTQAIPPNAASAASSSGASDSPAQGYLDAVSRATWIAGALAVLVAMVLGLFLSRRITLPLNRLSAAASRVASGDFSQRVDVRSGDELASLAAAFNTMAESLARTEEQRRRLFSDIAHELKTPIAVIQGNLEAIADGVADPTPERIASLQEETALLTRLVTDLRDLSLAESGQLELHPVPTDLGELVRRAVAGLGTQAEERGVEVVVGVGKGLPPVIVDPDRIGQVLRNLIANALRYTASGGLIKVSASLDGQAGPPIGRGRFATVSVADTGSGIPAEDLPHIFDRFYRVDRSRSRGSGGTGLGLAVVKQLVEAHGGRVWAESQFGRGTVFHISLPVAGG